MWRLYNNSFPQPQIPGSLHNPPPTGPSTSFKPFATTEVGQFDLIRSERGGTSGSKTFENPKNVGEKGDFSNPFFPEGIPNKYSLNEMAKANQIVDFMKWFTNMFPAGPNGPMNFAVNPAFLPAPGTTTTVVNTPTSNPSQFLPLNPFPAIPANT